ncbi:phosphonate ABC transporter ATP-binding protein [Devosia sp. Leaf64]|nr:phosphonate ABC transporter ATP-binding protein [Devosia sp. Leaf64]
MVSLRNVSRSFAAADVETSALDKVSLDIAEGEFVAVTGPSGCGKSTLLALIGLLDRPDAGQIQVMGSDLSHADERLLTHHRRRNIGFIFQGFNLIPDLTIHENVEVGLKYRSVPRAERLHRVDEALFAVGLSHRARHYPSQLSGGQQQRAAIARALVGRPALILADEPTGNLDSRNGDEVMDLMTGLVRQGATLVMVTHEKARAAQATRIVEMRDGQILQ